jgi:isopropylmalate/homocitrate/citramalate synthase
VTASYNHVAGALTAAGLETKGLLTPRRTRRLSHTVTTTVTTTVWVIYGVHNDTTDAWALALVAVATGFTDLDVLVLFVADDTNG